MTGTQARRIARRAFLGFCAGLALCAPPASARAQEPIPSATEPLEIQTATGAHLFNVEVARSQRERELGLMFRRSMEADHGMVFFFNGEQRVGMWMKNTYIPLDMVFAARNGRVVGVARNTTPLSEAVISSGAAAYAVIELNAGIADSIGLAVGDRVRHSGFTP
jgi:uncharacterized membrane protein (UPF0127 family)